MYNYCNPQEIKPTGWLRRQLEIQAKGLAGNLDKMWPDVRESSWIGGDKEGWERVPYWLDGFIPLAYLLENEDMKKRANLYVTGILKQQQEDGWICPCAQEERKTYDIWSMFLIGKVLALYCEYTDSKAAEEALYRSVKCMYKLLKENAIELFEWGKFRWYECLIPLHYLYERYSEQWILELGMELREQGADYTEYKHLWKRPLNVWRLETHIVNIAMMLKEEAVCSKLFGELCNDRAEKLWQMLDKYNGTAVSTFTGDECLAGIGNNRGTELCAVVELMYSCEILYDVTGDDIWAERLEKIAFNALPATISDDMWTHQYDQMVNQIACLPFPGKPFFSTNSEDAHIFGLEPNFGCCTANFGQGWPKLAMSVFQKHENGIRISMMLPEELRTTLWGADVTIRIETEYPFRHRGRYTVVTRGPVEFALQIRIPRWVKSVKCNGKEIECSGYYTINKVWEGTEILDIEFVGEAHYVKRPYDLCTVEYGPLVFSLPLETEYRMVEYVKDGVERKFPYCDYELSSKDEWRYGFSGEPLTVYENVGDDIPFSSKTPTISIKTRLARVAWDYAEGYNTVAARCPDSVLGLSESKEMTLIPYGCAKLRMTEMPIVK